MPCERLLDVRFMGDLLGNREVLPPGLAHDEDALRLNATVPEQFIGHATVPSARAGSGEGRCSGCRHCGVMKSPDRGCWSSARSLALVRPASPDPGIRGE